MEKPISIAILIIILLTAFSGAVTGGSPGLVTPVTTTNSPGLVYDIGSAPDLVMRYVALVGPEKTWLVFEGVSFNNTTATYDPSVATDKTALIQSDFTGLIVGSLNYWISFTGKDLFFNQVNIEGIANVPNGTITGRKIPASILNSSNTSQIIGNLFYGNQTTGYQATYEAHRGTSLNVTFRVENPTPATAGPFWVGFYLSKNIIITKNDIFIGRASVPGIKPVLEVPIEGMDTPNPETLIPFGNYSDVATVTIPTNIKPGFYYIGAIADYNNLIPELDEKHNYYWNPTQITIF